MKISLKEKIEESKSVDPDYEGLESLAKEYPKGIKMTSEKFTPGIIKALDLTFKNPVSLRIKYNLYLRGYRETISCIICGKVLTNIINKTCGNKDCIRELTERSNLEIYGTRRHAQSQKVKDKTVKTCMD